MESPAAREALPPGGELSPQERQALLRAASDLAESLDYEETLEHLAGLLVPRVADIVVIDIMGETGQVRRSFQRHADPARAHVLEELARRFPPTGEAEGSAPAEAIRAGRPVLVPEVTEEELASRIRDPDHRRLIRELDTRSTLSVPLKTRGNTIGALTLVTVGSSRRLGSADVELVVDVASRASLAIDNARLWEEARLELARSERAEREMERQKTASDLERRRLRTVLDLLPVGVWVADAEGRIIESNPAAAALWGGDAPGSETLDRYHRDYPASWPDGRPVGAHEWGLARAVEKGETSGPEEIRIEAGGGARKWILNYGMPIRDSEGRVMGGVALSVDITERKELEERQRFLSETSRILAESLDPEAAMQQLARHATGGVADYAIAYLATTDGELVCAGWAHVDPDMEPLVRRLGEASPREVADIVRRRVLEEGKTAFAPRVTDEMLDAGARHPEHLETLKALRPSSSIVVPLRTRGRIVGALAVVAVEGGRRPYSEADVAFIEEVGARAALAVDNARLFRAAQGASEAKSQFLAVMSHELRTPLAAIIGFADLLCEGVWGQLGEQQVEQIGRIRAGAWHLVSIIDQILTFSRAEAGKEQVARAATDMSAVVSEVISLMESQTAAKGIELRLDVPASGPVLSTDAGKLRQILLNVIGNAIKFTDAGRVEIAVTAASDRTEVTISDTGPGIPPEDRERVFEPFTQLDQSSTRTKGGAGLGLAVSRKLARLLGGDIVVESTLGRGSAFRLWLPREQGGRTSADDRQ